MQSSTFADSLDRCIELATLERATLMCAEAVPWRCHRSLIADALLARSVATHEITSGIHARPHVLTAWARVSGSQVTYPAVEPMPHRDAPAQEWPPGVTPRHP